MRVPNHTARNADLMNRRLNDYRPISLIIAIAVVTSLRAPALADLATLLPSQDNTLFEDQFGTLSNGAGKHMFTGTTIGQFIRRGLVKFDLSSIPAGSIITDVELTMHMSRTINAAEFVDLHRALADWGEGASAAPGEEGGGAPAEPGDATWLHTHYNTQTWTTPGGDFDPILSATQLVFDVSHYTWTATPRLLDDVQDWLDNPAINHGWLIKSNEDFPTTAKRFDTKENPNPAFRPSLRIEYTPVPEPTALAPLLLIALASLRRRPRAIR
jgi:hypothetical protein